MAATHSASPTSIREAGAVAAEHAGGLERSYRAVGDLTWSAPDFLETNLRVSRDLFTPESLLGGAPRPKKLEVFALLAGLPFAEEFMRSLEAVQQEISAVIGDRTHYWVAPENLGVEFCVFKWPSGPWQQEWLGTVEHALAAIREPAFEFEVRGIQVNPDGCVVAKGFDGGGALFRIRERVKTDIPFLPRRQSGWAHVPLGRILEPLGADRFAQLGGLIRTLSGAVLAKTQIASMKLIHERRWYMEERTTLADYPLQA